MLVMKPFLFACSFVRVSVSFSFFYEGRFNRLKYLSMALRKSYCQTRKLSLEIKQGYLSVSDIFLVNWNISPRMIDTLFLLF